MQQKQDPVRYPTYPPLQPTAAQKQYGRYPYFDFSSNFFYKTYSTITLLDNILKFISPFNPFKIQQVPSEDRVAFGPRFQSGFYRPHPYPNKNYYNQLLPQHYDPFKHPDAKKPIPMYVLKPQIGDQMTQIVAQQFPRGCEKRLSQFYRCRMINGAQKCNLQIVTLFDQNNILSQCPKWALDQMKYYKQKRNQIGMINKKTIQKVLQVAPYNKGRKVNDLPIRNWNFGTRHNLRPDTMWADQRYINITQKQIDEAKERVKKRSQKQKPFVFKEEQQYDWITDIPPQKKNIYP